MELHAGDRSNADGQKDERGDQGERHREDSLTADESFLAHRLPQWAKPNHILDVEDDTEDQHRNAERDQRHAEAARRTATARDHVLIAQPLEELEDREAKANQRE